MSDTTARQSGATRGDSQRDSATITEAARILGVSVRTVQRRLDNGKLESFESEGKRFVRLTPDATANATQGDSVTRHDAPSDATEGDTRLGRLEGYQMAQFEQRLQAAIAQAVEVATAPLLEMLKEQRAQIDRLEMAQIPTSLKKAETGHGRHYEKEQSTPRKVKPWQRAIMRMIGARE
jgi:excisionase family DNA binding protein